MRFAGKTVVVTGASSGLGVGMAKGFAGEGARVAVIGTNAERTAATVEAIRAEGGVAAYYGISPWCRSGSKTIPSGSDEWRLPTAWHSARGHHNGPRSS
jgi:NAD(P)-dependent dehydrogenase (short-subunit alcohol dehydrogenase family)